MGEDDARDGFARLGGHLALDFANTVDWRRRDCPVELLPSYERFLAWAQGAGLVDGRGAEALQRRANERPVEARTALARAWELREAIYGTATAVTRGEIPPPAALETLGTAARAAARQRDLVYRAGRFDWAWPALTADLAAPLARTASEAVALLLSPDVRRIRQCADDACGWLFLDRSRNHSRRWCSMSACGNRAKGRRFRARRSSPSAAG
ncbi:MAG: CGNR zinc finger domain-containing protein [Candidatus Bipolaricaulota bacterium]|nr:MAG: CGNR zinc finger domain-containing protein [Candidatus Bipolaricaulota bacterium]